MKKSITLKKLTLRNETLKLLQADNLKLVAGAGPVETKNLPCPIRTAIDCEFPTLYLCPTYNC